MFLLSTTQLNQKKITYCLGLVNGIIIGLLYTRTIYLFQLNVDKKIIGRITSLNEIIFSFVFVFTISVSLMAKDYFTFSLGWLIVSIIFFIASILFNVFSKKLFYK